MNKKGWIALLTGLVIACCCISLAGTGVAAYLIYQNSGSLGSPASPRTTQQSSGPSTRVPPTLTPRAARNTATPIPEGLATPDPNDGPQTDTTTSATAAGADDNLNAVKNAVLPHESLPDLAVRFKGVATANTKANCNNQTAPTEVKIGASRTFTLSNQDSDTQFKITARLEYKTEHVYMWVQTEPRSVRLNARALRRAADEFEANIYPTNTAFFGNPATPGVDCDPRLVILHAAGIGNSVGGYFSSPDSFVRAVRSDSNEAEMFVIHAAPGYNGSDPGSNSYMSTLAHEFQHMISYANVHAANLWLEEGAAQFAERLNGYASDIGTVFDFAGAPETQLNTWSESSAGENSAHYGAGYLFWCYLYDRFGEDIVKKLARNKERSAPGFMQLLADEGVKNPDTNAAFTFEDLFADFVVANFMNQVRIEEKGNRYNYETVTVPAMSVRGNLSDSDYPFDNTEKLNQFGTHYYALKGSQAIEISFSGNTRIGLVPMNEASTRGAFWYSMRADASNPRLTREIDLSSLNAGDTATLKFKAWYRLEKDYDYGYVSVSADGGATWKLLQTKSCTTENPQNANLGCGWTGPSNFDETTQQPQWMDEEADISEYSGKKVLIRFEAVSDAGVNREGIAIDDLEIPEINFSDNVVADNDWQAEGFVRVGNELPQKWKVQLIIENRDGSRAVERLELKEGAANTQIDFGSSSDIERVVLCISPTTQVTTEQAQYQLQIK